MLSSSKKPFVSVIVPVYNGALTIEKNIQTLLDQDYPRESYEIIIVDNGSTDSTFEVIKKYPVIALQENRKQNSYAARNKGAMHAKGSILAFTDTDCLPQKDWISQIVTCFEKNQADVVAGSIQFIFSKNPTPAELTDSIVNLDNKAGIKKGLGKTANLCITKECFDAVGSFSEERTSGGDGQWTSRALRLNKKLVFAEQAVVWHEARDFKGLVKKHLRVGQGSIGVWKSQNRSIFWMIARFFALFIPLSIIQVPLWIRKRRIDGLKYPVFKMIIIAYRCKLATARGIIHSFFTKTFQLPQVVTIPERGIIYGPSNSLKDFVAVCLLLVWERKRFFLSYVFKARFFSVKRSCLLVIKQDGVVIGCSVFSDFPLIPRYFDSDTLQVMKKLTEEGYQYAASFFIAKKYRMQGLATELLHYRIRDNGKNYYFVPSSKTLDFYIHAGAQKYYEGQHSVFVMHKIQLWNHEEEKPLISIIVPIYNRPDMVAEVLATVQKQTWKKWELIFIDDASQDTTWQVIQNIASEDSRVRPISRKQNGGVAAARNTGIQQAQGKYLAFLDSDDRWFPEKLEQQVKVFELSSNVGMVYSGVRIRGRYGMVRDRAASVQGNVAQKAMWSNFAGSPSRVMISRKAIDAVGFFDEQLPSLEDRDMWFRIAKHYLVGIVPSPLVEYYESTDSISSDTGKKVSAYEAFARKHGLDLNAKNFGGSQWLRIGHKLCYYGAIKEGRKTMFDALIKDPVHPRYWFLLTLSFFGAKIYYKISFFLMNYGF